MTEHVDDLLRWITEVLNAQRIPHMVVGSFASTYYGEPRTTRDLDLVIDPSSSQLEGLLSALDPDAYYVDADVARDALRRRTMFNVIEMATAWKLDLVICKDREFSRTELGRRQIVEIAGVEIATATAEDTIIAKLDWAKQSGSDRQLEDVAGILRVRGPSLDLEYVERWVEVLELGEHLRQARALST